jgi:transposase
MTHSSGSPAPRYRVPQRQQLRFDGRSLDEWLLPDHVARAVWAYVAGVDLADLASAVKAVAGRPGHPPIDPRIPLALWLLATLDGVGSARELDRLCAAHVAYEWICGEVSVNYHTLADFRAERVGLFERLLTEGVAALAHAGLAYVAEVAQDGVEVRASAGASSFRRPGTRAACLAAADARVAELAAVADTGRGPKAGGR